MNTNFDVCHQRWIIFCLPIYRSIGQGRNKDFRNVLLSSCDKECKLLNKVVNLVLLLVLLVVILNNFWQDLLVSGIKIVLSPMFVIIYSIVRQIFVYSGKGVKISTRRKITVY